MPFRDSKEHLMSHRIRALAVGLGLLALGAAGAQSAAAAVTLSDGHVDYGVRLVDGQLRSQIKDSTQGSVVWRDPADVTFSLGANALVALPADNSFAFVGPACSGAWLIPQVQKAGVLWAGWNTEEIPSGAVTGNVTWTLNAVSGPGNVALFQTSSFGSATQIFNSADGLPDRYAIPTGVHAHGNWAFTQPGTYQLTFTMAATDARGQALSDTRTLTVQTTGDASSVGCAPTGGGAAAGGGGGGGVATETPAAPAPAPTVVESPSAAVPAAKAGAQLSARAARGVVRYGQAATITVGVQAPGTTPGGQVSIVRDGRSLAQGVLDGGTISLRLPPTLPVGPQTLSVAYAGDDAVAPAATTVALEVRKARATLRASVAGRKLRARVSVTGTQPTGAVTVREGRRTVARGSLASGQATIALPRLAEGRHRLRVTYAGSTTVAAATATLTVRG
jgi:surface-anchored protein